MAPQHAVLAVLAVSSAVTAAGCSHNCTLMGCMSGASYGQHVELSNGPETLTVTACRNGACRYATVMPGAGGCEGCRTHCDVPDAHWNELACSIEEQFDGRWMFYVTRYGPTDQLVHGDVYLVRVESASEVLIDVEQAVVYRWSYPNGEDCGGACLFARIEGS